MPNPKPSLYLYALPAVIISAFLALSLVSAWTEPTTAPPGGNVDTPLNVGGGGQTKEGGLILNTGGAPNGLIIDKGNVGIGTTSPQTTLHSVGQTTANYAGNSTYYGGGKQHYYNVYGSVYGDGSCYSYGNESWTCLPAAPWYGGRAGGYFKGGDGAVYAGGGAGIVAIGGNAGGSSVSNGGGAGIFAKGGLNGDGSTTYAGYFSGNVAVAGQIKITGGTPGAGRVLTSDASGLATWEAVAGGASSWTLSGSNLYPSLTSYNVGVGTTSPGYKLDVAGDIHATGWLRTDGSQGWYSQSYGGGWYMSDTSWIRTYNSKSVWTDTGLLASNGGLTIGYSAAAPSSGGAIIAGNVGIGTASPGYKLDVAGGIRLAGKSALTDGAYFVGSPTYGFRWNSSNEVYNNVIMYDNGNMYVRGNIGIGTADPSEKLEVAGNVRIMGAGIYNSAGSQLVETNATDWTRWNQGSGSTNGNAMYQSLSLGTGGLSVGTWSNQGVGNIYATGNMNVNDVYLRSTNKWLSQGQGGISYIGTCAANKSVWYGDQPCSCGNGTNLMVLSGYTDGHTACEVANQGTVSVSGWATINGRCDFVCFRSQ